MNPRSSRQRHTSSEAIPTWGWWVIGGFIGSILLVIAVISGVIPHLAEAAMPFLRMALMLLILAALAVLYFIPTFIAKDSPRMLAIFVANFVFGWTLVGWVIVIIWALAEAGSLNKKPTPPVLPKP